MAYFALRLPISVVGFAVAVVMIVGMALLFTPLLYTIVPVFAGMDRVTAWQEALLISCPGAALGLLSAHAVFAVSELQRKLAETFL